MVIKNEKKKIYKTFKLTAVIRRGNMNKTHFNIRKLRKEENISIILHSSKMEIFSKLIFINEWYEVIRFY